ncbi:hypothetical protein [uncultured Flavobacterium sp.]|uniref:hypothetical protein n=1 Tax=uncultured Flavobacterium sp. TaxID=165435 RepID=UPI0025F2C3BA|nr:hypothetical protein [uncultured Flavobacterium sp.]
MKSLILFICCLIPMLSSAQHDRATKKEGLSKTELEYAKKLFITMMNSKTYVRMNDAIHKLNEKSSSVYNEISEMKKIKTRQDAEKLYRDWLVKNLKNTKFKSVEEGLAAHMEAYDLSAKNIKENPDFFRLLYKANARQIGEIMKPKFMADRNRVLYPGH